MKSQMKQANKSGTSHALIIGEDELARDCGLLRDMVDRDTEQREIVLSAEAIAASLTLN
jgi:histidyl-tRNA synthetase